MNEWRPLGWASCVVGQVVYSVTCGGSFGREQDGEGCSWFVLQNTPEYCFQVPSTHGKLLQKVDQYFILACRVFLWVIWMKSRDISAVLLEHVLLLCLEFFHKMTSFWLLSILSLVIKAFIYSTYNPGQNCCRLCNKSTVCSHCVVALLSPPLPPCNVAPWGVSCSHVWHRDMSNIVWGKGVQWVYTKEIYFLW